jgi:hypothetical protein
MAVFSVLKSGRATEAAASMVAVLDRCQCQVSRSLLTGALDAVVQLGVQLGKTREQLLHNYAARRSHA